MGKPRAPAAPDYAAAAKEQGSANVNAAVATNTLGRVNQVGPNGSLSYANTGSQTLPDGTSIPTQTATTTLSPGQQHLYDQSNQISSALNDAALQGTRTVSQTSNTPYDTSGLASRVNNLPGSQDYSAQRDATTGAVLAREMPTLNATEEHLKATLANQGLQPGSEAYNNSYRQFNNAKNDAISQAILTGGQEQSRMAGLDSTAANFANGSRQQGIQEQSFFRNDPINTLNALRTGNQVNMPQFMQTGSANVGAAPVYAATNDGFNAQMASYNAQMAPWSSLLGGLGGIGAAYVGRG